MADENKMEVYSPFGEPSDEDKKVLKGLELAGVNYEPLLVSKQLVSKGWNYLFVTNATDVTPGGKPYAVLVKFFQPTDGKAENLNIIQIGNPTFAGGYGAFQGLDDMAKTVFAEAQRMLLGMNSAACLVTTQIVAGRNYIFAVNSTPMYPGAEPEPVFLKVFQSLQGEVQIKDMPEAWDYR
jgi:hypothetical protein